MYFREILRMIKWFLVNIWFKIYLNLIGVVYIIKGKNPELAKISSSLHIPKWKNNPDHREWKRDWSTSCQEVDHHGM